MNKLQFFMRLNRRHKGKCFLLFLVFTFAGAVIAGTLFVVQNNSYLYQAQLTQLAQMTQDSSELVYRQTEHILSVFSLASILVAVWGGFTLLLFKDLSMERTFAMCKIYGMKKKDLLYKALADLLLYGILAGILGGIGGYWLFRYLAAYVCETEAGIRLFSFSFAGILFKEFLILSTVAFWGSSISGSFVYEKHILSVLNQRNEKAGRPFTSFHIAGVLVLLAEITAIFSGSLKYMLTLLTVAAITTILLYVIFRSVFSKRIGRRRNQKPLSSMWGLSFRFLCSRSKKDAVLAATVSVGAILICFIMNVKFNFTGIITDSYRDNMGYSVGVRVSEWSETGQIERVLDENGYSYSLLYSKLMPYKTLYGMEDSTGEFWAAVVGKQTDANPHFSVPDGTFAAEDYFSGYLNIEKGDISGIFGKEMPCERILSEVQALSLMNYSMLINEADWQFGLDDSFSPIFLMDLDPNRIRNLKETLSGMPCEVQTASMIADALQEILSKYISVVILVGSMLVLVTSAFFYSMIQNDLCERRTETFLYRIYGASKQNARRIIYQEYMMIALIASFSVVLVIMIFGEAFFLFFLQRHYPVSVLVVLATTSAVAVFVMLCCVAAEKMDARKQQVELIRDE